MKTSLLNKLRPLTAFTANRLFTTTKSTNNTHLIKPHEYPNIHVALLQVEDGVVTNAFLEKKGGPLKKLHNFSKLHPLVPEEIHNKKRDVENTYSVIDDEIRSEFYGMGRKERARIIKSDPLLPNELQNLSERSSEVQNELDGMLLNFYPTVLNDLINNGSPQNEVEVREVKEEHLDPEYPEKQHAVAVKNFPQKAWHEFLDYLNPTIVNNFKLRDAGRADLIHSYNFCLSDDAIITRNRSSEIGTFPLIRFVLSKVDFEKRECPMPDANDVNYTELIDQGRSAEILQEYFAKQYTFFGEKASLNGAPWASNKFLKRVALAPSLKSAGSVGMLLAHGALDKDDKFDAKSYDELINKLPSSVTDPEKFKIMLDCAKDLEGKFSYKAASNLFLGVGNKWVAENKLIGREEFELNTDTQKNYFDAIARDLMIPAYYAKLKKECEIRQQVLPDNLNDCDHFGYLAEEMRPIATEKITAFLTPATLRERANRLHRNRGAIDVQKPFFKEVAEIDAKKAVSQWHAIIENQNIDGYQYEVLSSSQQLTLKAAEMQNCVGGFTKECMDGTVHIIAGKAPNSTIFLVELLKEPDRVFLIQQIKAIANAEVSQEIKAAVAHLVEQMNSGKITVNTESGSVEKGKNIKSKIGFDPHNSEEARGVYKLYQEKEILPAKFKKCNLDEFLTKSGLDEGMDKIMKIIHPKDPSPSMSLVAMHWDKIIDSLKKVVGSGRE